MTMCGKEDTSVSKVRDRVLNYEQSEQHVYWVSEGGRNHCDVQTMINDTTSLPQEHHTHTRWEAQGK